MRVFLLVLPLLAASWKRIQYFLERLYDIYSCQKLPSVFVLKKVIFLSNPYEAATWHFNARETGHSVRV